MVLSVAALVMAGCGQKVPREVAQAMAPVRLAVDKLSTHGKWRNGTGHCLCVGMFREEGVEDFPPSLLDDVRARHAWVHNWSECAPYYGRKAKLAGCGSGKTDYICMVTARGGLPEGMARVLCHAAGESKALQDEYLQDEYDVSEKGGGFTARPVSEKALKKLYD